MPLVSNAQTRAMYAAKEGHSTLGIPQKVGAEFVTADYRELFRRPEVTAAIISTPSSTLFTAARDAVWTYAPMSS